MIPFDFDYYKPSSISEAVELHRQLDEAGKQPVYYSGGTEIITLGRLNLFYTEAVIDIKGIPECCVCEIDGSNLHLGAGLSLAEIERADYFPLLTVTSKDIADNTARMKITLGGNVCSELIYREAILPFLLSDSHVITAGASGEVSRPVNELFNKELVLERGEFLVRFITEERFLSAPYFHTKRRKQWNTGYPLITVAALQAEGETRTAYSGLSSFPFRSQEMDESLNLSNTPLRRKAEQALNNIPHEIISDSEGSAEYRKFVLKNVLMDVMTRMGRRGPE
ncbi:FAD binding domain-containing protein [Evansella sp. LMS18]|uniref:FAD binding domain-containing protein n=1 Tax=Evansella sp. LMS18 TaxID=2924033 RepID=UPI0020D093D6|nr:FAD binding domain-containing protein [Evansella sp. LMS18]UTR09795.1 FAD binding domain-containing protein [Evansella sp. LMS18]